MTDPLSVAAGVIGIVTAAVQISSLLVKFTVKIKDAPNQASVVLAEVNDTSTILAQLQPFLLGLETPDQSRACLLQVESVIAILTGCVMTFSELQELLDNLEIEEMQPGDCLKWIRKESAIAALLTRLQTHKASLSLMLNMLNCNTMSEVKTSVDSLHRSVQQSYLEILCRVRGLENQQANSLTQDATAVNKPDTEVHNGRNQELSREGSIIGRSTWTSSRIFNRTFEKDLAVTRAYKRIKWRCSITSIFTTEHPETRWSTISDLSVADVISTLSVYELAITPSEIHQPQQYTPLAVYVLERAFTDSPNKVTLGIRASVPEASEKRHPSLEEATVLECLWQSQKLVLPELTDALLGDIIPKALLPRRSGSEDLSSWLFQINELKSYYENNPHAIIPVDQVANSLGYFDYYQRFARSLTTDQVLRDILQMLGVLRPDLELLEIGKHTLYIFSHETISQQRHQATIRRLKIDDAPLKLVRSLQMQNLRPRLVIQPRAIELPTSESVDVTHMNLGHSVNGVLLHSELYSLHLCSDDTIQHLALRMALYYYFLDPMPKDSRTNMTKFISIKNGYWQREMLGWAGLAPTRSNVEHTAGGQIYRPACKGILRQSRQTYYLG